MKKLIISSILLFAVGVFVAFLIKEEWAALLGLSLACSAVLLSLITAAAIGFRQYTTGVRYLVRKEGNRDLSWRDHTRDLGRNIGGW